jgi:5'-3' exonuclease
MIDLYDGNNVMRRAMERGQLPQSTPMTLRQRYEATCNAPSGSQIWVWDGYRHNERRQEIYPRYKTNREPAAENIFAQIGLWKEVLALSPATQITVHGWEADDVISTLTRRFARRGIPTRIHSNDMDYAQLGHYPSVTLVGVDSKGVHGRWVALYKAMVGDTSDHIAGIPGFGPKRWLEMEDHWPQIERAIIQGTPEGFVGLPFKPAVIAWLASEENIKLLQAMLTVTHFHDVPDDELEGGIKEGKMDRLAAHARLSEFFL